MNLMEALATAQKEISSQSEKLNELGEALERERGARSTAEEKAERLQSTISSAASVESGTSQNSEMKGNSDPTLMSSNVQERVELMRSDMDQMRAQLESYRQRAELAEGESRRDRKSLAEMVESIRRRDEAALKKRAQRRQQRAETRRHETHNDGAQEEEAHNDEDGSEDDLNDPVDIVISKELSRHGKDAKDRGMNGTTATKMSDTQLKELSTAVSAAADSLQSLNICTARNRNPTQERLAQSAPYASILGVVLLGFGMMAYMNGWQRVTER